MKRKRTRVTILTSPISCFYKGNRQKDKTTRQHELPATKQESSNIPLHGSYLSHLLMGIFALLHFSAAPKLSIKGQESTDMGRDTTSARLAYVRSGVARPVLILSASLPSPFPLQICQVKHHLLSIFLMPSRASDLSLEYDGSGFSACF